MITLIIHQNFIKESNMFKPTFLNICICTFIKYIIFYIFLMIANSSYGVLNFSNIRSGEDLFYFLWIMLFFPVLDVIIFSAPLYYSFKIENKYLFFIIIFGILSIEYFLYAYFTSQKTLSLDGLVKAIISFAVLTIFFYKKYLKN
ncbi:hypothetical protein [Chryseobacterium camelliae]|uniref:hypothetical protein n=1 Tax=Chryseobacterium camelliae TaxID=1265445 RepID=UPI0012FD36A2|nr:hypothetical protein [Chryseobacterium camelliae]